MELLTVGYVVLVLAAIALAVGWVLLPFALFGVKPILRELLLEQKRTNALLQQAKPEP